VNSQRWNIALSAIAVFAVGLLLSPMTASTQERTVAVLQGLDKVTARISEFNAELGVPVTFGTLEITVQACHKKPPEEPPESTAFIEIREKQRGEPVKLLFSGWMFASTPGLSALEHPVYDVWVLDCAIWQENSESNG
jgi:hypothetical protein